MNSKGYCHLKTASGLLRLISTRICLLIPDILDSIQTCRSNLQHSGVHTQMVPVRFLFLCCTYLHFQNACTTNATVVERPAMSGRDVISTMLQFVPEGQFLFVAPVSRTWREGWGKRPTVTRWITQDSTRSQLLYSFRCGLSWGNTELCSALAKHGKVELLQYARTQGCRWDERACSHAAGGGHIDTLQCARGNDCPWDSSTSAVAVRGGRYDVLR